MWAKQSTAATLIVGPILDSAGAEYASAVIGDLSISKNGGTLIALAAAATLTHIANGQYTLVMTTGNLDTLGRAQITCNKSTYQMPEVRLMVVPAMVFDSMILGSDRFDVNVTHVADTTQTAGDIYASQVAIAGYIDTEVSAIKTKTDQLTFTTANKVDSTAELDSATRVKLDASQPDYAPLKASDYVAPANSDITAIKARTDNLPTDPADASDIAASFVTVNSKLDTIDDFLDTEIAAIKAKTDNLPADPADQSAVEAAITAATSPLATPAQVNAEIVDALSVDTYAELSAPPAASSSLKDKLTWLFMYARNKVTQTASQRKLYRDDGTTVAGTSGTSDDGTTFTKGEDA